MTHGPYPLEQLALIKQKKLDEAEKILKEKKELFAKEQEKYFKLEKERDKVKEHRKAKLDQLREKLDAGTPTDKIQQMKLYLKEVDEKLKQKEELVKKQLKQLDAAKAQVEQARADFIKRQQDVEKIKLHRKQWEKEMNHLIEQGLAIESDEIGSAMYSRRKREKKTKPTD